MVLSFDLRKVRWGSQAATHPLVTSCRISLEISKRILDGNFDFPGAVGAEDFAKHRRTERCFGIPEIS
jgi:hypothetical protein